MPDLTRFLAAQAKNYDAALAELTAGRKISHWMWYVFPQLAVLGRSETALYYGISDLAEAEDYASHPILGQRLHAVAKAMLLHPDRSAEDILGPIDARKLNSSATLFAIAAKAAALQACMDRLLATFHGSKRCSATLAAIADQGRTPT